MLELFKGQIDLDQIKYELPYKEALLLRDVRAERLKKEKEEIEKEREAQARKQERENTRNKILMP